MGRSQNESQPRHPVCHLQRRLHLYRDRRPSSGPDFSFLNLDWDAMGKMDREKVLKSPTGVARITLCAKMLCLALLLVLSWAVLGILALLAYTVYTHTENL